MIMLWLSFERSLKYSRKVFKSHEMTAKVRKLNDHVSVTSDRYFVEHETENSLVPLNVSFQRWDLFVLLLLNLTNQNKRQYCIPNSESSNASVR